MSELFKTIEIVSTYDKQLDAIRFCIEALKELGLGERSAVLGYLNLRQEADLEVDSLMKTKGMEVPA